MDEDKCPYSRPECFEDGNIDSYCLNDEFGVCPTKEETEKHLNFIKGKLK